MRIAAEGCGPAWNTAGFFEVDKRHLALRERLPLPDKDYLDYITGDGCGNLYLGLLGTGILQFHVPTGARRMFVSEDSKGGMANNWVTTMLCDSKQRLWIGHFGGLSCYDIRQGRFLPLGECARLGKGACYRLLEGRGGDIWIGTSRGCSVMCRNPGDYPGGQPFRGCRTIPFADLRKTMRATSGVVR